MNEPVKGKNVKGKKLTQADVDGLPIGARVIVTWSGGNGPSTYEVVSKWEGRTFVVPPHLFGRVPEITPAMWHELHNVGDHPKTQVWTAHG